MSLTPNLHDPQESGANWIPLMEYAMKKGVSLSTLRRHIKAGKIHHRIEGGRYLLLVATADIEPDAVPQVIPAAPRGAPRGSLHRDAGAPRDVVALELALRQAQEEIAELKTLVAFYEEQMAAASRMDC
jgi:hypothetical protein